MRAVKSIVPTHRVQEGGGFWVRRPAAMGSLMSPFLLLDEMGPNTPAPGEAVGAPWHPHRGFETVTYLLEGRMQHEDSAGNKGELNPGDVQWMTAGRGIVHSEEPHEEFSENRWDDTWVPNLGESSFKTQNDVTKISGNPLVRITHC